jgi:hypothetical protein
VRLLIVAFVVIVVMAVLIAAQLSGGIQQLKGAGEKD